MSQSAYRVRNSTADRALAILELFSDERPVWSAADVAASLGTARSTAYRYLETLESSGYVEAAPGGGFRLGMKVIELARIARKGLALGDVAVPHLRRLATEFNATAILTRRAGATAVCLECEHAAGQLLRLSYERGTVVPITAGASGLVLLAGMAPDAVARLLAGVELPAWTARSLTRPDAVADYVRRCDEAGVYVAEGMVDPHVTGVAAPIRVGGGEAVAGLSVVMAQQVMAELDEAAVAARVKAVADEIGARAALAG